MNITKICEVIKGCLDIAAPRIRITFASKRWWNKELRQPAKTCAMLARQATRKPDYEHYKAAKSAADCPEKEIIKVKRKTWNDFLLSRNRTNIWQVMPYVKEKYIDGIIPKLNRQDGLKACTLRPHRGMYLRVTSYHVQCQY